MTVKAVTDLCILEREKQPEDEGSDIAVIEFQNGLAFSRLSSEDEEQIRGTTTDLVYFKYWSTLAALLTLSRSAIKEVREHEWCRIPVSSGIEHWLVKVRSKPTSAQTRAKKSFEKDFKDKPRVELNFAEKARTSGRITVLPGIELGFEARNGYFLAVEEKAVNPVFAARDLLQLMFIVLGDPETGKISACEYQYSESFAALLKELAEAKAAPAASPAAAKSEAVPPGKGAPAPVAAPRASKSIQPKPPLPEVPAASPLGRMLQVFDTQASRWLGKK